MYSFEKRSPASSDWVSPAATRSWRRRVPRPEVARCGARRGVRMRPSMLRLPWYRPSTAPGGSLARVPPIEGLGPLGPAGFVELRVDRAGRLRRHARDALELLLRCGEKALGGAEVLEQCTPADRAHALELVEDRGERARVSPLTVEADREAVSLVADPLQQLKPRRVRGEHDRVGPAWDEHFLDSLGERHDRDAREIERLHCGKRGGELALPAVDDDEIRRGRARLVVVLGGHV